MRRIAHWLAVATALTAGAAAAQPSHSEGEGTIRGRIMREGGPAAGLPVMLYAISEAGEPGVARSVSDERGRFVFAGVSTNPNTVYLVGVRAHEIPFGTRAGFAAGQEELEVEVRIAAFDTDTSVAHSGDSTLRIDRSCEKLQVSEAHELHNPTDRVIYLREAERAGRKPLFRAELPALLSGIKETAAWHNVRIINFGHTGDGNVHVNVLKDEISVDRWEAVVPVVTEEIYQLTLSLGGMLTGEHGIGATHRQYLPLALEEPQIEVMRCIREAFDPHRILNPGKIFP